LFENDFTRKNLCCNPQQMLLNLKCGFGKLSAPELLAFTAFFTIGLGLKITTICVPFDADSLADTSAYCFSTENNLFFTLKLIKYK